MPELLAELPTVSEDGLTLTLQLRTGDDAPAFATNECIEGGSRPVKANDVRASILRHADTRERRAYSMLAGRIDGFDEYSKVFAEENPKEPKIIADDEKGTVVIPLTRPQPEFVALLANPQMSIIPAECPNYWDGFDRFPFRGNPAGSGPYLMDQGRSMVPKRVVLVRNPVYKGNHYPTEKPGPEHPSALPGLPEIEFEHVKAPETALRLFQHDELALLSPGQSQFNEVFENGQLKAGSVPEGTHHTKTPVAATTLLLFDFDDPVVGNGAKGRALRRAVSLAFDIEKYEQIVRNGSWATPAARLLPPGVDGSKGEALHAFAPEAANLDEAKKELSKAGLSGKELELTYVTSATEAARQEAAILTEALRPLGITLKVTHEAKYQELLADPEKPLKGQLFSLRWDFDYPDAENVLRAFTCAGDLSALTHHCDAKFDAQFEKFSTLPVGDERTAMIEQLERYLGDEAVARPVDHPELWMLAQPWIHNVIRHPLSGLRLELAHL